MIIEDYLIEMDKKIGDFSKNISKIKKINHKTERQKKIVFTYI